MTRRLIAFFTGMLLLLLSGCEPAEKTVHEKNSLYAGYWNLGELCETAAVIVHGTVDNIGKTWLYDADRTDGREPSFAYTPYELDVIEFYKGDTGKRRYTWQRSGGETRTDIYKSIEPEFEPGTEVIFFCNMYGCANPYYGIYEVVDETVRVRIELFPDLEPEEENSLFAQMKLADFRERVLKQLEMLDT